MEDSLQLHNCIYGFIIKILKHIFLSFLLGSIMKSDPSQFLFLHSFYDTVPPNEACFYSHISCCVAQALRHARAKTKGGFMFNVHKQPVLVSGGAFLV